MTLEELLTMIRHLNIPKNSKVKLDVDGSFVALEYVSIQKNNEGGYDVVFW